MSWNVLFNFSQKNYEVQGNFPQFFFQKVCEAFLRLYEKRCNILMKKGIERRKNIGKRVSSQKHHHTTF